MNEDSEGPGVVLVDRDGQLTAVAEALRRGGVEDVRTVADASAIAADGPTDCVIVPYRADGPDVSTVLTTVRERIGDVPVGVYLFENDRETLLESLEAGADTVLSVPPKRATVLASRVRHLAGVADVESPRQQFASFLTHYPESVYLKDRVGRFVNITAFAFEGFEDVRLDREHALGLTDYELYEQALADGLFEEEQELLAREESIEDKIEHYLEDGEDRWVSTTKVPRYDEDGALLGLVGNVRDVTTIKRQERTMAALHEASRRLVRTETKQAVGRTAIEIVSEIDLLPQGRIDLRDARGAALETVAATDDDVAWDDSSFRRAGSSGTTQYRTVTGEFVGIDVANYDHPDLRLPDGLDAVGGLRIPLGDHGALGIDAGEGTLDPFTIELAHVLASNTEAALDRAEQERQLTEQADRLEEFAALGSHELRNRLQVALGTAERARAQEDVAAVDDVIETLGRMNRLISQLLALARTGTVTRGSESIALSGISTVAWETVEDGSATLSVESDGIVTADRDGLLEILEILFRLVVDGSQSNDVRVGTLPDGFYLEGDESVVDPDERDELFEPTYSDVGDGTGDSVYLVAVIAHAHDWTISVSDGTEGTRFSFGDVDVAHVEE